MGAGRQIVANNLPSKSARGENKNAQCGLSSGRGTSRRKRDQQRALKFRRKEAASRQYQLLSMCVKLKDLCINGNLKTTLHINIMEQLRNRADRFRKQGRLQDEDLEEIINKIKAGEDFKDDLEDGKGATAAKDKHGNVLEAVEEGLLQVHGTAPNSKQQGIFWIMGKNCNGLNNKIGGNDKIAKILDIKEDLDINCLMFCKHCLNFRHKDNKNDLRQMFQRELACMAISAQNIHKAKFAGWTQEGGTGTICFSKATGYIKKTGQDKEGLGRWSWILLSGMNGHNT
jgi:hypothetical protein